MGHGGNVIDELKADHREVEEMFGRLKAMTGGGQELRGLIDEITIELVRHSVAEEQYLYPAVREQVEGGGRMADREIEDHSRVEKILKQLEQISTDDAQIKPLLKQLMEEVTSHIKDEESNLFPALERACTSQQLDDLGDKIRRAKAMAPTRPHPAAPSSPTASKLLAPGAGLVDRARDFVTGRGTS
ncbi:hemerythrin domain-containing protein [Streptomyces solicathayae]|uniref:Hemerythrin domain-containing protein n=1 Tax=Streptomyces solicathayae TaxID=3081768 RepID=A0ABZ0LN80_9ACTN|nr:hemerythrin domain-containing protein [Streptomyces sp. HUAS YS2]WOX20967.1 hemerythrin domain-containing protein [Streptomyces sp. HUAS YS2]